MTEPVTDDEIVAAARERCDCACVSVSSWRDDQGAEWIGCMVAADKRPGTGTTWTLLGCSETREGLLRIVR